MADLNIVTCCLKKDVPLTVLEDMIPGTVDGECSQCSEVVLLAPSSQRLVEQHGSSIMCGPCSLAVIQRPGMVTQVGLAEGAREELLTMRDEHEEEQD